MMGLERIVQQLQVSPAAARLCDVENIGVSTCYPLNRKVLLMMTTTMMMMMMMMTTTTMMIDDYDSDGNVITSVPVKMTTMTNGR